MSDKFAAWERQENAWKVNNVDATSEFKPPYFYVGLSDDEEKAEKLTYIKEENAWIGCIEGELFDYVLRYSRTYGSYALVYEAWDTCKENIILEVRDEHLAKEILRLVASRADHMNLWTMLNQLEKSYCKDLRAFMNYYGEEHTKVVTGFITGLKRELALIDRRKNV